MPSSRAMAWAKSLCLGLTLFILAAPGCAVIDMYFLPTPEDTAQELYEAGADAMQQKNYYAASEYFDKLKNRYPFSPYTPQAELGLGDAFYLNGDYKEAIAAYKEFETLHPRHEDIPYVLYQIGLANVQIFSTIDRPQHQVTEALQYFYRLKESYPGTEYAARADEHILLSRRYLAEHEAYVADFYWSNGQYGAAYRRYIYVQHNFQDVPPVAEYAEKRAKLAYLRYQEGRSETLREEAEGSWKDYFKWL